MLEIVNGFFFQALARHCVRCLKNHTCWIITLMHLATIRAKEKTYFIYVLCNLWPPFQSKIQNIHWWMHVFYIGLLVCQQSKAKFFIAWIDIHAIYCLNIPAQWNRFWIHMFLKTPLKKWALTMGVFVCWASKCFAAEVAFGLWFTWTWG